ncbi:MAG: TonB-dependent receptor [Pseudomonadota bacterium]
MINSRRDRRRDFRRGSAHNSESFERSPLARAVTVAIAASLPAVLSHTAHAAEIEEVIVTATKRAQSAQEIPLAITALSGDFTRRANINDVKDLVAYSPGVSGNSQDSFIDAISIRGVRTQDFGVGGDPSAAFFKNDLYEGRNGSAVTSLYDMERTEILRGPQGFLFGRNSIGGAFSVHTAKAEVGNSSAYVEVDVGERGHRVVEGAINLPVNDTFAMRLAGYYSEEDGFVDNGFGGPDLIEHEKEGFRWSTTLEDDRLLIQTMLEYETRNQSGSVYRAIEEGASWDTLEAALGPIELRGGAFDADSDQISGDADDADLLTLGLKVEYDFDFATLTSNTGYKDHDYFYTEDYDGTPLDLNNYRQQQTGDYLQQEFRLTSNGSGPLSWYTGASFYREDIDALFSFEASEDLMCAYYGYAYNGITFSGCADLYAYYGSPFSSSADGRLIETGRIKGQYEGWAAYVDFDYAFNDGLDAALGIRYSEDDKEFAINVPEPASDLGPYWAYTFATDGFVRGEERWDDTQLRLQLNYRPGDDGLVYASYTEGFKAGGFGSFALLDANGAPVGGGTTGASQAAGFQPNAFNPEVVDSFEVGYKNRLFDGRAALSLAAFLYQYEDLQVVVADGGASAVENVGEVDGYGVEGTLDVVLNDYFDLYLALSYLDTEATGLEGICGLDDPNGCEGSSLFWAPEVTAAAVVNGNLPLGGGAALTGRLEVFYESERGGGFEGLSETEIDPFTDVTLRVGYQSARNWSVDVYAENLTNEDTFDGQNNNGGIVPAHFFGPKRPRTIGVRLLYSWQ